MEREMVFKQGPVVITAAAPTDTPGSYVFAIPTGDAGALKLVASAINGLTGTIAVSYDNGTTYYNVDVTGKTGLTYLAGQTITFSSGMELTVEGLGVTHIKVTRVGGTTGSFTLIAAFDPTVYVASLLAKLNLSANGKTIKSVSGSVTADTDIIAAVSGKRIKVIGYAIFTFGVNANVLLFKSGGTSGTLLWTVCAQALTSSVFGGHMAVAAPSFIFGTVVAEKLTLDVSSSDTIYYSVVYFDDDAT